MMTVPMDNSSPPSSRELASRLYKKNIELENGLKKSAQSTVPSDLNAWVQMRKNYEAIILEDRDFSEKHEIEQALWQLHYRKIEEFRAHIKSAASARGSIKSSGKSLVRPDRIKKIHSDFKTFLSEATGFYHDLILKIRAKYGLPLGYFSEDPENQIGLAKDEKRSAEMKKGLISCHRYLVYLGDLARYKGFYGEGDSGFRDYAAASSYYIQAASFWPSSGNPHHQLAILASYSGNDLVTIYRYFRSLAVDSPVSTARDNLIIAFEKDRQSYSQLLSNAKVPSSKMLPAQVNGRGKGRGDSRLLVKETKTESTPTKEQELSIPEIIETFSIRFVRLNGILFTRTNLETFGEILSSVISDLYQLLSCGPEEELNFGQDAAENGLVILRLTAILIFTVHNVNRESKGQSYAEILQRTVLLQNAFTAAFEVAGCILERCIHLHDAVSSYLLPAVLVFVEWLACHPQFAAGIDDDEKQGTSRSFFWNQFIPFVNKLMVSGFASINGEEHNTCFFNMGLYEEGDTGNRLALWEDFELRGFSPLVPAQLILDFSRKYSFGSDGSSKEKKTRVRRILAAGRALLDLVRIDQQGVYYDSNLKKFVIGIKPTTYEDHVPAAFLDASELYDIKQTGTSGNTGMTQANSVKMTQLSVEGDEEDEVIVFKPTVGEKYTHMSASKLDGYDNFQTVQNSSNREWTNYGGRLGDWTICGGPVSAALNNLNLSTAPSACSQLHLSIPSVSQLPSQQISPSTSKWFMEQESFVTNGLKNLNIVENGLCANPGLLGLSGLQPTAFTPSLSETASLNHSRVLSSQMNVVESVIPSNIDSVVPSGSRSDGLVMKPSAAMSSPQKKTPIRRPVRYFGPPPGFSNAPITHVDPSVSEFVVKDQDPHMDDYCWLDGHQKSSTKGLETINTISHTANMYAQVTAININTSTSAASFPYPGKQISTVQTQITNKKWKNFELFQHLKLYSEQQL